MRKEYISYKPKRDVLFVFGAGASIADGGPFQSQLLPRILATDFSGHELAEQTVVFIRENFDTTSGKEPSLESVFGYLEYFISKKESLKEGYNTLRLIQIKESLIRLIHHEISKSTKSKGVYKSFFEKVSKVNKNVSIITMNYDTLLDESFDFLYSSEALIDYCINFMNYDEDIQTGGADWWINPREPVTIHGDTVPSPIKIIKIHGSINWKYCNCCNQVLLTPWNTGIDLESQGFKGRFGPSCENPEEEIFDLVCHNDKTPFDTFIVPPSHIKGLNHPAISKLFDEAAIEIRKTKKIVFVGFSFPEADVHIKALFKKNIKEDTTIEVVDPFMNDAIRSNYLSLSQKVSFIPDSFENYIENNLAKVLTS